MRGVFVLFPSVSKNSQKQGLEEAELSWNSYERSSCTDCRRAAEAKGFREGFAKGFEEGKKEAKATAFEEGSQASKAKVAALKQQLKHLTAQLEKEVLLADNL